MDLIGIGQELRKVAPCNGYSIYSIRSIVDLIDYII